MSDETGGGSSHLSRIETLWSVVRRAHQSEGSVAGTAQKQLLECYGGAVRRYLLASLKNQDLADELFQEFALKFVGGSFRNVDPEKGRFRFYVKTVLSRMIAEHYRKKSSNREQHLLDDVTDAMDADATNEEDEKFLLSWREEILDRTWRALADHEAATGAPYNSVLRLRVAQPTLSSDELAEELTQLLGKETSPGSARVLVHRAREKFAKLLIDVIGDSLQDNSEAALEAELIDLRLIAYCRDVMTARKNQNPSADA